METFALVALIWMGGEVHQEVIDYRLSEADCRVLQVVSEVYVETEADHAPLLCMPEVEA